MSLPPNITVINTSRFQKVKVDVLPQFIVSISQKSGFKYNLFEVMVLYIKSSSGISANIKSLFTFVLATVNMPPGNHTYFIKEFADFLR